MTTTTTMHKWVIRTACGEVHGADRWSAYSLHPEAAYASVDRWAGESGDWDMTYYPTLEAARADWGDVCRRLRNYGCRYNGGRVDEVEIAQLWVEHYEYSEDAANSAPFPGYEFDSGDTIAEAIRLPVFKDGEALDDAPIVSIRRADWEPQYQTVPDLAACAEALHIAGWNSRYCLLLESRFNFSEEDARKLCALIAEIEEAEAKAKAEAWVKAKAEAWAEAWAEARAEAKTEAEAWAGAEAWAEAWTKAKAWAEAESEAWTKAEAKVWAEAEAKAWAEARAKAKAWAEVESEAWAEARAKAKAWAEAEARAEAKAWAEAESEARAKDAEDQEVRKREEENRKLSLYIKCGDDDDRDAGLKAWSTKTRWKQYQSGSITRAYAVSLAFERAGVSTKAFLGGRFTIRNWGEIPAMLEAAQKRCRERLISLDTIRDTLRDIEYKLWMVCTYQDLGDPIAITVSYDGGEDFARSYKYVPYSTHFKARFDGTAWEVTEIFRDACQSRRSWVASAYDSEGRLLCHV